MPVNESNTIQYTVTTSRVPDGTTLYWKTTGNTTNSDIVGGNTGSIVINNNQERLVNKIEGLEKKLIAAHPDNQINNIAPKVVSYQLPEEEMIDITEQIVQLTYN